MHNHEDDVWVSFLGNVFNLTPLIAANHASVLAAPLVAVAGTDISHWFDAKTKVPAGPHPTRTPDCCLLVARG